MAARKRLLAYAIIAPFILLGTSLYLVRGEPQIRAAQGVVAVIPQPQGWVAFDADYSQFTPQRVVMAGRYYRASDGSTRQEGSVGDPPTRTFVDLVNIPRRVKYLYISDLQKWRVRPIEFPSDEFLPLQGQWRVNTPGLTRLPEPYEGLEAYLFRAPKGEIYVYAPALNFFSVRTFTPATDMTHEYRNIKLRPQSSDLFVPPPEVTEFDKVDQPFILRSIQRAR